MKDCHNIIFAYYTTAFFRSLLKFVHLLLEKLDAILMCVQLDSVATVVFVFENQTIPTFPSYSGEVLCPGVALLSKYHGDVVVILANRPRYIRGTAA